MQLVLRPWHKHDFRRFRQRGLELLDVAFDLRIVEDVAIDLRERRVSVRDSPQQDHEFEQIGVRLLPERLLGPPEQVVQQGGDRVGHRVRIEIVVQRVVADA